MGGDRNPLAGKLNDRRDARAHDKGHEQQEADDEHEPKRGEPGRQKHHNAAARRLGRHVPELVQRRLQLDERRRRAKQEGDETQDGWQEPRFGHTRAADRYLYGRRGLRPDQIVDLAGDLATRGFLAQNSPGNGDQNDQQRRQREQGVERQRARMLKGVLRRPESNRVPEQGQTASSSVHRLCQPS